MVRLKLQIFNKLEFSDCLVSAKPFFFFFSLHSFLFQLFYLALCAGSHMQRDSDVDVSLSIYQVLNFISNCSSHTSTQESKDRILV